MKNTDILSILTIIFVIISVALAVYAIPFAATVGEAVMLGYLAGSLGFGLSAIAFALLKLSYIED